MKAVQREQLPQWKTICSNHFKTTDFLNNGKTRKKALKTDAVPTQQMPAPHAEETRIEHRFRERCRYCLELIGDKNILIDWDEWPYAEFSDIYENITNLKVCCKRHNFNGCNLYVLRNFQFPISKNCSVYCCYPCVDRLRETLKSLNLFRNAHDFWVKLLKKDVAVGVDLKWDEETDERVYIKVDSDDRRENEHKKSNKKGETGGSHQAADAAERKEDDELIKIELSPIVMEYIEVPNDINDNQGSLMCADSNMMDSTFAEDDDCNYDDEDEDDFNIDEFIRIKPVGKFNMVFFVNIIFMHVTFKFI